MFTAFKKNFPIYALLFFFGIMQPFSYVFADSFTWTTNSNASGSRKWEAVASSDDGTKLVAVVEAGYIYTSTDSGATWTARTGAGSRTWRSTASSSDGTKLVAGDAASFTGYIYTSTDSGATWTERTGAGAKLWESVASSADGLKLIAGNWNNAKVHASTDGGATWAAGVSAGTTALASSDDGVYLYAVQDTGVISKSSNSGGSWSTALSGTRRWTAVVTSADGSKVAAAHGVSGTAGSIWLSTDYGANWTEQTASFPAGPGSRVWDSLAMSSDGLKLVAGVGSGTTGALYTGTNSGGTWTWVEETGAGTRDWQGLDSSTDGTKIAATAGGSSGDRYIWIGAVVAAAAAPEFSTMVYFLTISSCAWFIYSKRSDFGPRQTA